MKHKLLKRLRGYILQDQPPVVRLHGIDATLPSVQQDLDVHLPERKANVRRQFKQWREIFTGHPVTGDPLPSREEGPTQRANLCFVGSVVSLLLELILSFFLMGLLGPPIALLFAIALDRLLDPILRKEQEYKDALRRTLFWLFTPGGFLLLLAILGFAVGRGLFGALALVLGPILSFVTWFAGVGFLLLAAGFAILFRIYDESRHFERRYNKLLEEERNTRMFREDLIRWRTDLIMAIASTAGQSPTTPPAPRPTGTDLGPQPILPIIALFLFIGLFSSTALGLPQGSPPAALYFISDATFSSEDQPQIEVVERFRTELPSLCETFNIVHVAVYKVINDAWNAQCTFAVDLPSLTVDLTPTRTPSEAERIFPGIAQAFAEESNQQTVAHRDTVHQGYQAALKRLLSPLDKARFIPSPHDPKPTCSDIDGMNELARSLPTGELFAFVVVSSDFDPVCRGLIKKLPPPSHPATTIAVVLPEKRSHRSLHLKQLTGSEFFHHQRGTLLDSVPWMYTISHHNIDFASAFKHALSNR